jgi:alpha-D-glucose phosphate-specific phosphoglucomutase
MSQAIKFGTSGWRAVIADDFTFANVRRALTGIARYVRSQKAQGARLIVARDPRFLGESLVTLAVEVLSNHGITPLVIPEPAPTPAVAYEVLRTHADGAINFTASHNPPQYNGIKFSTPDGAPALPEVTRQIEANIEEAFSSRQSALSQQKHGRTTEPDAAVVDSVPQPQPVEIRQPYLDRLRELVDLKAIRQSGIKVAFDPLWGAARGYTDTLLRNEGSECVTVHDFRDVLFGGHAPEPDGHLLNDLRQAMQSHGAAIGVSTDGDGDRFGILDADGTFIQPNYIVALLFDYLVESRGWRNGVAKSVATTNLINALAEHHKVPLYETPVGFKFIGELIKQDKIAIGGEESAGLSIRHHVPEKDGILAGLLCCEMVAKRGEPIATQLRRLFAKVGSFYPLRENFRLTPEVKATFTRKLEAEPRELFGRKVQNVDRIDGMKLVFTDGAWICYRLSGTEPVVRVYTEARSEADLQKLSAAAKEWIFQ